MFAAVIEIYILKVGLMTAKFVKAAEAAAMVKDGATLATVGMTLAGVGGKHLEGLGGEFSRLRHASRSYVCALGGAVQSRPRQSAPVP